MVETSAGESASDEASLVRFLLHASAWDVEGILATGGEHQRGDAVATGHSAVRDVILGAYAEVHPRLVARDPGFPTAAALRARTLDGTAVGAAAAVALIRERLMTTDAAANQRPLWYLRWSAPADGGASLLRRALDGLQADLPAEAYRRALGGLHVVGSGDALGPHVDHLGLELDTGPAAAEAADALEGATGRDADRDLRAGHGPLAALYPDALERATITFLPLLATGLGAAHEPRWQSWGGRFAQHPGGAAHRWVPAADSAPLVARWAAAIQNELAWRADLCLPAGTAVNRPPVVMVQAPGVPAGNLTTTAGLADSPLWVTVTGGSSLMLDSGGSSDPDGHMLRREWFTDAAASTAGTQLELSDPGAAMITVRVPDRLPERQSLHLLLAVTDSGMPPLTRYRRVILTRAQ